MYITLLYDFVANNILFNICVHVNLLNFGYSDLYFKNTIIQSVYFKPNRFCSNIMHKHSTILGFYRVFFKNSLKTQQTLPRTRQPKMPHTCSQLSTLQLVATYQLVGTSLSILSSCNKPVIIGFVANCHLPTCYNLLEQLAGSLLITSLDNQLATSL